MKNVRTNVSILTLAILLMCGACAKEKTSDGDSGSDSQTTANDSSGTKSRKALGVDGDNQKEVLGYPSNQSNLNSDSTRKLHDPDTTSKAPLKDKPNRHQ